MEIESRGFRLSLRKAEAQILILQKSENSETSEPSEPKDAQQ
jgi:hypothetical protein